MRLLWCLPLDLWTSGPLGLWSLHSNVNTTGLCSLMLNTNVPLRTNLELRVFNIIYWKKNLEEKLVRRNLGLKIV